MKRRTWPAAILVCVGVLLVQVGVASRGGLGRPVTSDALYFRDLAVNLADGHGYVQSTGFWPGEPSMERAPGWPLLVSVGLRATRGASPDAVMRLLACGCNAMAAGLFVVMAAWMWPGRRWAGLVAGVAYGLHPTGLYFAAEALSEPMFVAMAASGCLLLMRGGWGGCAGGALCMGLAALVRVNYVLWAPFVALLAPLAWRRWGWGWRRGMGGAFAALAVTALLGVGPALLWAARNAGVCGAFPVLSSLKGAALHGSNNALTADTLEYWGYWVFPDDIPGETPKRELARTMSEYEVDCHYAVRGRQFLREHWFAMPRLLLGKLVRAYVPMPWRPSWAGYAVAGYRWLLGVLVVVGIWVGRRGISGRYVYALAAMALANLAMVLVFYGSTRLAFTIEVFLVPFAGVGLSVCKTFVAMRFRRHSGGTTVAHYGICARRL